METFHPGRLLWAAADEDAAAVTLCGWPMDATASFRAGSRFGPQAIREASHGLEDYSPELDAEVPAGFVYDAADLVLPFGNVARALDLIRAHTAATIAAGRLPFGLGGEHLASMAAIESALEAHPDLVVVQLDAHTDLREHYIEEPLSHATFLWHIGRRIGFERIVQLGVRSGSREEFGLGTFFASDVVPALADVRAHVGNRPVYLTLDIDVADPAAAPGTGTPEPGGLSARELLTAVRELGRLRLVAADIVEVLPAYDTGGITAMLAAKCLRELLIRVSERR